MVKVTGKQKAAVRWSVTAHCFAWVGRGVWRGE